MWFYWAQDSSARGNEQSLQLSSPKTTREPLRMFSVATTQTGSHIEQDLLAHIIEVQSWHRICSGLQLNIFAFLFIVISCVNFFRMASQYNTMMAASSVLISYSSSSTKERQRERERFPMSSKLLVNKYHIDSTTYEPTPGTKGMSCTEWLRTRLSEATFVGAEEARQDLDLYSIC